ncbi:hypothetical protein O1611_g587 [Lasiodiplodia mahajangana]|uniref:Uncharacterized protein n=1 Tax=Lasiodiplodia mahajangana TaxID=1108764 RepID=A0ACC2JZX8_9PEZI|nr:hypothetical protein O1611_g587 [Lasiodiplodia mahajangana]
MSRELQKAWDELLSGVAAVRPFPFSDYVNRLHNKVRWCFEGDSGAGPVLAPYINKAPNYPPDDENPELPYLDIFLIGDLLDHLSISSASDGVANNDVDSEGLKRCVSQENSKLRYLESLTNLTGFCFLEHINLELRAQGRRDLGDVYKIEGFKEFCLEKINSADFANIEIRHDLSAGDHRFTIAWLIIADYMDNRTYVFRNTPSASGSDFATKASHKALAEWSKSLWANDGKGDPDQMDRIVEFCGKAATIGLCPSSVDTGLQRPTTVSSVMKAFYSISLNAYEDGAYAQDVKDSLNRLQDKEEIIDEWKSYCSTLTNTWVAQIRPYWKSGFYQIFQANQSKMAKLWLSGAYQLQPMEFQWKNYFPISQDPYDGFSLTSTPPIPAGTPIALADGTQKTVEALNPQDQVLTHAGGSKTSTLLVRKPSSRSESFKLVQFNGERPLVSSAQVFHTSTGLRAVDPEEAQRQNPHEHIGKLAVGHIIFRLKESGQYQAVSINSISPTEDVTIDRAYTLSLPAEHRTYHVHGYLVDKNAPSQNLTEIIDILRRVPGSKRLGFLSQCQETWPMFRKFDVQCIGQRLNWELFGTYQSPDGESPNPKQHVSLEGHIKLAKALRKPVGVPIDRVARAFILTPHYPSRLPVGYQLPALGIVDGYLLVGDQVLLRTAYDAHERCFRWTRELGQHGLFEHGAFEVHPEAISGAGVVYLSPSSEADVLPPLDQVHQFQAHARSLDQSHVRPASGEDTWMPLGKYDVTIDKSIWPPDTDRTEPVTPVSGGIMEDGYMQSPYKVSTYMVQFPLIEQLRTQINDKFSQNLGSFCQVSGKYTDGLQTLTVWFNRAPLVPFVSDAGLDVDKKFEVGFGSTLGVDVTLPTLFQQMTFTFDVEYKTFSGYFYEYDPTKRGYKGNRHLVTGKLINEQAAERCRAKISTTYASIFNPNTLTKKKDAQPAPVTKNLMRLKAPSVDDLMKFTGYDERTLHNTSQLMIKNMMYYHMDKKQREDILHEPLPVVGQDIPGELADQLPGDLKDFFKNKYAPAFICRYVGKTQKYSSEFTPQEMKNLWYWWEGNGKNSLSQSKEYNDINRLSSRAAMNQLYEDKLALYLNDNPDQWAKDLSSELLGNKHQMLIYMHTPIQDGNNVINKQCSILDVLSPSADKANEYFKSFMAFALKQGVEMADIEDGNQDEQYKWIYDSMHDMIVAILEGAAWVAADVRESLAEDINEFEKQNGLNHQAEAEQRAAAILEKSAIFTRELAGWMSSVGKGLQAAFGGSALFKWIGEAFDTVSAKFASILPGVGNLKGLSTACMAGISLATAAATIWGLVNNWNTTSDAEKAVIIIESVRMVVDAAEKSLDAFKSFKSKAAATPADQVNVEALAESLSDVIMENNEKMGELAEKIAGREDYRTAMGEGLHGNGVTTESESKETFNEEITDTAEGAPPGSEEAAKKFNISGNVLKALNVILGVGLVVAMSFSLANDWSSMDTTGKVFGVLNVIVQGLTVLLDIIDLGKAVGLFAITGSMSAALSILGAVLAIIGIVLMIVQLFISFFVAKQDPPDPIGDFLKSTGHKLVASFDKAPSTELSYTISTSNLTGGSVAIVTIEGTNTSSKTVVVSHATITLYSGDDDVCLFGAGAGIALVQEHDQSHDKPDHIYITPSSVSAGQLPKPAKLGNTSSYYEYDLQVAGPPKGSTSTGLNNLSLKPSEAFKSVWTAVINKAGSTLEKSTSWIEVVEVGLKDKCQTQFMLQRLGS